MGERHHLRFQLGMLLTTGREIRTDLERDGGDPRQVNERYQSWYTQTLRLVERVLPERRGEFEGYYGAFGRADEGTTIALILADPQRSRPGSEKREALAGLFDPGLEQRAFLHLFGMQLAILASAAPLLEALESAEDRGLRAAEALLARGHRRAAVALTAAVLEGHLEAVAARRRLVREGPDEGDLRRLNRRLRRGDVYGREQARRIDTLARRSMAWLDGKRPSAAAAAMLLADVREVLREVR